jgi:hypothetical protein
MMERQEISDQIKYMDDRATESEPLSDPVTTVEGTLHVTSQEATTHLGLFADNNKAIYVICMHEVVSSVLTPQEIWVLFVHLFVNNCVSTPMTIWHNFCNDLV